MQIPALPPQCPLSQDPSCPGFSTLGLLFPVFPRVGSCGLGMGALLVLAELAERVGWECLLELALETAPKDVPGEVVGRGLSGLGVGGGAACDGGWGQ